METFNPEEELRPGLNLLLQSEYVSGYSNEKGSIWMYTGTVVDSSVLRGCGYKGAFGRCGVWLYMDA